MHSGKKMSTVGFHCDSYNQNSQEKTHELEKLINKLNNFLKLSNSEYSKKSQRVTSYYKKKFHRLMKNAKKS